MRAKRSFLTSLYFHPTFAVACASSAFSSSFRNKEILMKTLHFVGSFGASTGVDP